MTPAPPVLPRPASGPPPRRGLSQTLVIAAAMLALIGVSRACFPGGNRYERLAQELTDALQRNDMAAVQKVENSETAAEMSRVRVAQAADALAPLGKIERVKETFRKNEPPRVYEFDVRFQHGTVHERMQLDPQGKVVHFHYDPPVSR